MCLLDNVSCSRYIDATAVTSIDGTGTYEEFLADIRVRVCAVGEHPLPRKKNL